MCVFSTYAHVCVCRARPFHPSPPPPPPPPLFRQPGTNTFHSLLPSFLHSFFWVRTTQGSLRPSHLVMNPGTPPLYTTTQTQPTTSRIFICSAISHNLELKRRVWYYCSSRWLLISPHSTTKLGRVFRETVSWNKMEDLEVFPFIHNWKVSS